MLRKSGQAGITCRTRDLSIASPTPYRSANTQHKWCMGGPSFSNFKHATVHMNTCGSSSSPLRVSLHWQASTLSRSASRNTPMTGLSCSRPPVTSVCRSTVYRRPWCSMLPRPTPLSSVLPRRWTATTMRNSVVMT